MTSSSGLHLIRSMAAAQPAPSGSAQLLGAPPGVLRLPSLPTGERDAGFDSLPPPPKTPAPSVPPSSQLFEPTHDIQVAKGSWTYIQDATSQIYQGYIQFDQVNQSLAYDNAGRYLAECDQDLDIWGFGVGYDAYTDLTNGKSGQVYVHLTNPYVSGQHIAFGFTVQGNLTLKNAGLIQVVSDHGDASGLITYSDSVVQGHRSFFENTASGVVRIDGADNAAGINGAYSFSNAGLVQVVGRNAHANDSFAIGVYNPNLFDNSGTLRAIAGPGGTSIAIYTYSYLNLPWGFVTPHTYVNSGTIDADFAFYVGTSIIGPSGLVYDNSQILNSGTINGDIYLPGGTNEVVNTGQINGVVFLGDEIATYTGTGGQLNGTLVLGAGTNTVTLGDDGELVVTTPKGKSAITGGAGDDVFALQGGSNVIDGGGGTNSLLLDHSKAVSVDLSSGKVSGGQHAKVVNIQDVAGSGFGDVLKGSDDANILDGGPGQDTLTGRGGEDVFVFSALADSSVTAPDLITDFTAGDRIDLSAIDADAATPGRQAFHLGPRPGHTGDLVVSYDAAHDRTVVDLYVDADSAPDARIWLNGHISLGSGDLVL